MSIRNKIINWLGGYTAEAVDNLAIGVEHGAYSRGYSDGQRVGRVKMVPLPLPFTDSQLQGRQYGEFITPGKFADVFGECSVAAPGPHGFQQLPMFALRNELNAQPNQLRLSHPQQYDDNPQDNDALVPVIVTVLR